MRKPVLSAFGIWTLAFLGLALALALSSPAAAGEEEPPPPPPNLIVPYVPSPQPVVDTMLELAKVGEYDIVYDLGCGDGRIVVTAVKKFSARKGVGIDLNPQRIKESKENAEKAGVADKVEFRLGDLLDADLKPATVVTCYLLPRVNLMIRPMLFRDLKPGCRVVSHAFTMGEWKEDLPPTRPSQNPYNTIYFWIIPASVGGTWEWTAKVKDGEAKSTLALQQSFQVVQGTLTLAGAEPAAIADASLKGPEIAFSAPVKLGGQPARVTYRGKAEGDTIEGTQEWEGGANPGKQPWTARRAPLDLAGAWKVRVKSPDQPLDGALRIERKDGVLTATYTLEKENRVVPIKALYAWGASVRFEIPGEEGQPPVVFRGTFRPEAATGTVSRDGWANDLPWSAEKIGR